MYFKKWPNLVALYAIGNSFGKVCSKSQFDLFISFFEIGIDYLNIYLNALYLTQLKYIIYSTSKSNEETLNVIYLIKTKLHEIRSSGKRWFNHEKFSLTNKLNLYWTPRDVLKHWKSMLWNGIMTEIQVSGR